MHSRPYTTKLRCNFLLLLTSLAVSTLLTTSAHAAGNTLIRQLQEKATQQKLWQQTEWLNLLHFEGDGKTPDDYKSSIRDKKLLPFW